MCAKIAYGFWKKKSAVSSVWSLSCENSGRNLSINQSVKSQKQCVHSRILPLCLKVCVKRHQHQFTVVLNNWTFRRHHKDEFRIKTLVWRHTKFNLFRSWSQLTIQCIFASLSGPAIDLQKVPILAKKNHLFRWCSFWSWRLCKQAKLSHLWRRKPARIHWKADTLKTSHCLVWILVQMHNWAIFLRKWARRGRVERIFIHKSWTGQRYVPHSRIYTRCFASCFWRLHYQPQSWCRLASSKLRFDTVGLLFLGFHPR